MKLRAFSFLEVMVSIVISGIVISIAYSVFIFTHKQFFRFTSIKTEIKNYFELTEVLNNDFETANKVVKKSDQEIEMQLLEKNINYFFDTDYILRTVDSKTDTFFFTVSNLNYTIINELKEEPLIESLMLNIEDKSGEKIMSFYKNYGAILEVEE
ncbi:MAG: hypothetical protein A3K10_17215 [Bacteroidetes bacterium RIFCSPLOWO2_12_FULL_31_6]|nr:MAG: hypothetical protein A3K10_17215 [Bacteroidetes bacterium RIFCSPLOWO2_12_FULL_31_6]